MYYHSYPKAFFPSLHGKLIQLWILVIVTPMLCNSCTKKWAREEPPKDFPIEKVPLEFRDAVDYLCADSLWGAHYKQDFEPHQFYLILTPIELHPKAPDEAVLNFMNNEYIPSLKTNLSQQLLHGNKPIHYNCSGVDFQVNYDMINYIHTRSFTLF